MKPFPQHAFTAALAVSLLCQAQDTPERREAPQWQIAAGGKMSFEVASIKPALGIRGAGFALDAGSQYRFAPGGFSAAFPLISYVSFAYKLTLSPDQRRAVLAPLPKWVGADIFEIQARAPMDNPTKDQLRLMMQSLLAERFGMTVHFETQTVPVFALVAAKSGKLGPWLRPHEQGPPCTEPFGPNFVPPAHTEAVFPAICEIYAMDPQAAGIRIGSRNTTMQSLASMIPNLPFRDVNRPVVDRTGLSGRFDFTIEWARTAQNPALPNGDVQPELAGTTATEALGEQLGLKLEPTRAPIEVLIIDHVEMPSEN